MRTLVCVPIFVEAHGDPEVEDPIDAALADASLSKQKGADLVEFRIDRFFSGSTDPGRTGVPPVSPLSPSPSTPPDTYT
ncbi:MAG: hypothetical protein K8E66_04755, partial [Phycisphaerales bacterium]|nr:hypothetical protein [Phycisphaerales bacterium]